MSLEESQTQFIHKASYFKTAISRKNKLNKMYNKRLLVGFYTKKK